MNFYCFFRCTTLEYAEKFLTSGNLRFGTANEWIKEALINEEGRGDLLEGSYIATNDNLVAKIHSTNKNIKVHEKNNLFFIQRTKVLKLRAYCLYGLSELNFTKSCRATNKMKVPAGEISKDYFCTFFPNINQQANIEIEKYNRLQEDKEELKNINTKLETDLQSLQTKFNLYNKNIKTLHNVCCTAPPNVKKYFEEHLKQGLFITMFYK